jgi:hypothetical protein
MWIAAALSALLALPRAAHAGEWAKSEIDPKVITDVTAYTVDKKHLELGLFRQEYGLLHNLSIGTRVPYYLLAVPNAHAKVTAIQTPKLDVAIQAEWMYRDLQSLGVPNGTITLTPITWTGSWLISQRLSLHFGTAWTIAAVNGSVIGADISDDLAALVGADGGLYAGANLTLFETDLAVEFRINRRDTLLFVWRQYAWVNGLAAGGVALDSSDIDVEIGPSVKFRAPLKETLPALVSLSWQWSWEHLHVRVGIPLPLTGPGAVFALPQAFALYWDLGPKPEDR